MSGHSYETIAFSLVQ